MALKRKWQEITSEEELDSNDEGSQELDQSDEDSELEAADLLNGFDELAEQCTERALNRWKLSILKESGLLQTQHPQHKELLELLTKAVVPDLLKLKSTSLPSVKEPSATNESATKSSFATFESLACSKHPSTLRPRPKSMSPFSSLESRTPKEQLQSSTLTPPQSPTSTSSSATLPSLPPLTDRLMAARPTSITGATSTADGETTSRSSKRKSSKLANRMEILP